MLKMRPVNRLQAASFMCRKRVAVHVCESWTFNIHFMIGAMFNSFSIKALPNWVFAVLIGTFWLDSVGEETLFARFDVWMVCLVLLTVYLAMQRNQQGEWEWGAVQLLRCGFAIISAVILLVLVDGRDFYSDNATWALLFYIVSNWMLASMRQVFHPPKDSSHQLIHANQHGSFEPLRIPINSLSEQRLKLQTILLCACLCGFGYLFDIVQTVDWESTTYKLITVFTSMAMLLMVGFKWVNRRHDLLAWRFLSASDGEYLDINPQGLTWRLLSNHAPSKWQQELRLQFRLDQHSITWPQLKNVQVLADGSSDNPIVYLWLTTTQTHDGELVTLRINETHTVLTSKQLRQLLLQYHNLGMKPFHTIGKNFE